MSAPLTMAQLVAKQARERIDRVNADAQFAALLPLMEFQEPDGYEHQITDQEKQLRKNNRAKFKTVTGRPEYIASFALTVEPISGEPAYSVVTIHGQRAMFLVSALQPKTEKGSKSR